MEMSKECHPRDMNSLLLYLLFLMVLLFRTEVCAAETVPELRRAFEAIETQNWTDAFEIAKSRLFRQWSNMHVLVESVPWLLSPVQDDSA